MKWLIRSVLALLLFVSFYYVFGFGALTGKHMPQLAEKAIARAISVASFFRGEFTACGDTAALQCGFQDTSGRVEVNCADYTGGRTAVLMVFGQSNSANSGRDRYIPMSDVANFNFHDGNCYKAEDPLLGPNGSGGSVWGVLADQLIIRGHYDRVLLVPFGIGGSSLAQWQTDGFLHPILQRATTASVEKGITATHVLWHQGESDAKLSTSETQYITMFEALVRDLRSYGIDAPVYPAIATWCMAPFDEPNPDYLQGRRQVRAAQAMLPQLAGVFPGPDTDIIEGELFRHDNCHFNAKGMRTHANLWLQAITEES